MIIITYLSIISIIIFYIFFRFGIRKQGPSATNDVVILLLLGVVIRFSEY